jgi:PmbA protein
MKELAEKIVSWGIAEGADEVEASVVDGYEFHVDVRIGKIENLVEAGSRICGFRIIKDKKTAVASSSDLAPSTLRRLVRNAVKRAERANPDPYSGLAPLTPSDIDAASLRLHDPEVPALDPKAKIGLAFETERIALKDKRITNSHGSSFATNEMSIALANSNGFSGTYAQTFCGLSVGLQAGRTDGRVEDYWSSSKRFLRDLAPPEEIARTAVQRTIRHLNPRKIKTCRVPVIFEPPMTSWLMGFLFSCASGSAIYQKASFLAGKLGKKIGCASINVVDDGLMPKELGSRPFDSDGLPCRRTVVIEKGVLRNYLCNTYAARKLGLSSTGNAEGGSVSPNNFYLQAGNMAPEDIIASTRRGLLLTRTIGHGLNSVTGDISRGAFGLWIENGAVVFPVSEVTIAGNLGDLLNGVEMIGRDLDFLSPVAGPTVRVAEMTVAGE